MGLSFHSRFFCNTRYRNFNNKNLRNLFDLYFLGAQELVLTSSATPNFKSLNFAVQILPRLPPVLLMQAVAKSNASLVVSNFTNLCLGCDCEVLRREGDLFSAHACANINLLLR